SQAKSDRRRPSAIARNGVAPRGTEAAASARRPALLAEGGTMSNSHLDDPAYDITAMEFHRARELPVRVHGKELHELIGEVEALNELINLPDEQALGDFCLITTVLLGVKQFLHKSEEGFDTAGGRA